jgi:hypothetical protein
MQQQQQQQQQQYRQQHYYNKVLPFQPHHHQQQRFSPYSQPLLPLPAELAHLQLPPPQQQQQQHFQQQLYSRPQPFYKHSLETLRPYLPAKIRSTGISDWSYAATLPASSLGYLGGHLPK